MDKEEVVHTYNGTLCGHKNNEILTFSTMWVDVQGIVLRETHKTEKEKYHMISLICGI